jgi:ligand-binding sensor domain-containing protein
LLLRNARWRWVAGMIGLAVVVMAALGFVRWRAQKALSASEREVASEQNVRFEVRQLPAAVESKFEWISAPTVFSQAAEFQGHLFLCGPAGLYEYGADGKFEQQFYSGKELPSSPLTRIATGALVDGGQPELVIATKSEGVLAYNGARFRQIRPADAEAREITAILPLASGQLLIGTSKKGVLVYDGKRIAPLHPSLSGIHVTELAGNQSNLWIGTIDRGVLHWHSGQTDEFDEAEGLPDPQVLSLLVAGERTFAGTPLGVAEFTEGRFTRVLGRGAFAQALGVTGQTLLIGTMDQGVIRLPLTSSTFPKGYANGWDRLDEVVQVFDSGDRAYALARKGVYGLGEGGGAGNKLIESSDAVLTDANVSALSIDAQGRLWVGYFDRGLDIVDPGWHRARHVENDRVFCVNRIVSARAGADNRSVMSAETVVATANGLVMFDAEGNERQVLTRSDGLIADHVTDVSVGPEGLVIATPSGITFLGADGARSLYAFQGLVNNHVYALGRSGNELLAGTLGGISVLDRGQLIASYTTANSSLSRNWISAVVSVGRDWMIGTYGGGIVRLDDPGRFHSYDVATANFEVNPNAMLVTEKSVFAGSLERGLFVYNRGLDRWSKITAGLPSENVTALAENNGYIYIGTDNGLVRSREQDLEQ